jgi:hypothetical protein
MIARPPDYHCKGKVRFRDRIGAEMGAIRCNQHRPHHEVEVYRCRYCKGWHVGRKRNGLGEGRDRK